MSIFNVCCYIHSKKLQFSDDEDQTNEKLNKQSMNGDIRNKPDNVKGYFSNKIVTCDPNLIQNMKVKFHNYVNNNVVNNLKSIEK